MPDLALFGPYVVPVIVGLIVVRLMFELLFSLARRGSERAAAVRRAWGRYLTGMFLAGIILPFISPLLGNTVSTVPFWMLLFLGGFVAAAHNAALAGKGKGSEVPQARQAGAGGQSSGRAQAKKRQQAVPGRTPARTSDSLPAAPSWSDLPDVQGSLGSGVDSVEQAIGKLPMPAGRKVQGEPLPGERVEVWFERQDARLGRMLEGKTLAAARLRLSTVKSMLLLGQIGVGEADKDVDMVLRRAGRG